MPGEKPAGDVLRTLQDAKRYLGVVPGFLGGRLEAGCLTGLHGRRRVPPRLRLGGPYEHRQAEGTPPYGLGYPQGCRPPVASCTMGQPSHLVLFTHRKSARVKPRKRSKPVSRLLGVGRLKLCSFS